MSTTDHDGAELYLPNGILLRDAVDLANATKTNPWFTISWNADADYIRRFATYVRTNLDPGLVAHVENNNEVWNRHYVEAR